VKLRLCFATRLFPSLLLFLAATSVSLAAQTVIEDIVARVNDSIITRSDLQRSRDQVQTELKQQAPGTADQQFAAREKDLLRDLIDQKLLLQKGKDAGISGDTQVIKRLDELRKSMNLETMEDMEKAAQSQGVSFEDFKENLRTNIVTQQVISQEVGKQVKILPAEVTQYYVTHKKEMEQPEQVRLAEILVSTEAKPEEPKAGTAKPADAKPADAVAAAPTPTEAKSANSQAGTPAQPPVQANPADEAAKEVAAEAKAKQLLDSIRKGAKFEDVAKKSSDGPTADQGGDLGFFKRGTLAKELEDKTFAMKPGDVSDVIKTKQGFIILKVLQHDVAGVPPQKDVENQIYEALYYEKLQPTLRSFLTKLREEAYIDIKPGFIDSGASPNQTKPIVTSVIASADTKSSKKRKKKLGVF
jgi:peptidyl-prolyl cis-trans isomerase SurA